jgi:hypothetical protein
MREQQEQGTAVEAVDTRGPAGPSGRRWREGPWAVVAASLGVFVLGAALSWGSLRLTVWPWLTQPAGRPVVSKPRVTVEAAADQGMAVRVTPLPPPTPSGAQITVTWVVANTGGTTWTVDGYRFVPEGEGAPVLSLPASMAPKTDQTIRAVLTVPPINGIWEITWTLVGPKGPVPGARLLFSAPVIPPQ